MKEDKIIYTQEHDLKEKPSTVSGDEKIDEAALRILEKHRRAFEELAKE